MALASDCPQYMFLDSSTRNRTEYKTPGEFVSVVKQSSDARPDDVVGVGYPLKVDIVVSYTAGPPDRIVITTAVPASTDENIYLDHYIEIADLTGVGSNPVVRGSARVIGFSASPITILYLSTPIAGVVAGDTIFIRQFAPTPQHRGYVVATPSVTSSITAPANFSAVSADIIGMKLRIVQTLGTSYTTITAYNNTTKLITYSPALTVNPAVNDIFEVYNIRDNYHGLSSPGSASTKNSVNYEISLEWLRVPRQNIFVTEPRNGDGLPTSTTKTISEFPYLMIEFRNTSGSSENSIQTNNRNTRRAQFLIPVEDLGTNTTGKFFTFHGQSPIVNRFNPLDMVKFGVYLPDGTPLQFSVNDDQTLLTEPNPDVQIYALFKLKRML